CASNRCVVLQPVHSRPRGAIPACCPPQYGSRYSLTSPPQNGHAFNLLITPPRSRQAPGGRLDAARTRTHCSRRCTARRLDRLGTLLARGTPKAPTPWPVGSPLPPPPAPPAAARLRRGGRPRWGGCSTIGSP